MACHCCVALVKDEVEKLGLEVTRPYKDLHSFDSSKVKCIGLIKDLCITLVQIPSKSMVMDVVVLSQAGLPKLLESIEEDIRGKASSINDEQSPYQEP